MTAGQSAEGPLLHLKEHPEAFRLSPVAVTDRALDARWTVDEVADLEFVRAVYAALGDRLDVRWGEVLDLLARRPDLARLNAHVRQKTP